MRVLVTGATGFIGQYMVKKIHKLYQERALVRENSDLDVLSGLKLDMVYGDLNDLRSIAKALQDVHVLIHLAALLPGKSLKNKDFWEVNVEGTRNLLKLAAKTGKLKQFIYCSTSYINWGSKLFANENSPQVLDSFYVKTKYEAEKLVQKYGKVGKFSTTIVRPGFVYGNHRTGLSPIAPSIKSGRFFYVGGGNHFFELVHIDDLTRFFKLVINNKKAFNHVFIVSEKNPHTFKKVVGTMAKELGCPPPKFSIPRPFFAFGMKILFAVSSYLPIKFPFSQGIYKTLAVDRKFNVSKAEKVLGFRTQVSPEKGIRSMVKWYKNSRE